MTNTLAHQIASRLNELEVPPDILRTKKLQHEFKMWKKGRRLMIVIDLPDGLALTAFKKLRTKITK